MRIRMPNPKRAGWVLHPGACSPAAGPSVPAIFCPGALSSAASPQGGGIESKTGSIRPPMVAMCRVPARPSALPPQRAKKRNIAAADNGVAFHHFTVVCRRRQCAVPPARVAPPDQSRHAGIRTAYLPRSAHRRTRPQPQIPLSHPHPAYSFFIATASAPKSAQRRTGYGGSAQSAAPPTIQAACGLAQVRRRSPWATKLFRLRADRGRAQRRPGFRCPPVPAL